MGEFEDDGRAISSLGLFPQENFVRKNLKPQKIVNAKRSQNRTD